MKFFKGKEDRLQYQFLPAAEEIVETPPSPFGRVVLWLITALLIVAIAWSYFGKLDIIAPATGKVMPEGSIKTVQPASPGVVTEIKVSEGQKVKSGQVIARMGLESVDKPRLHFEIRLDGQPINPLRQLPRRKSP